MWNNILLPSVRAESFRNNLNKKEGTRSPPWQNIISAFIQKSGWRPKNPFPWMCWVTALTEEFGNLLKMLLGPCFHSALRWAVFLWEWSGTLFTSNKQPGPLGVSSTSEPLLPLAALRSRTAYPRSFFPQNVKYQMWIYSCDSHVYYCFEFWYVLTCIDWITLNLPLCFLLIPGLSVAPKRNYFGRRWFIFSPSSLPLNVLYNGLESCWMETSPLYVVLWLKQFCPQFQVAAT